MEKGETKQEKEAKISVKQEQIHDLLFNREIGWQEIIYDLINTEQLDPWDIDIILLADKYLERIRAIEEADFFISSKVLLAASLLLRIKSEILLDRYIKSIDEILFGKKEQPKYSLERIELDENIPELIPRSPLPRFRKLTLKELMESLNKAIITENRRIRKEIITKNALRDGVFLLPKRKFSIKNRIKEIYRNLLDYFKENKEEKKIPYTEFINNKKEEKIFSFLPLLHLEEQKKIWLEQEKPFEEIYIWLKETFLKHNPDPFADLKKTAKEENKEKSEVEEKSKRRKKKFK